MTGEQRRRRKRSSAGGAGEQRRRRRRSDRRAPEAQEEQNSAGVPEQDRIAGGLPEAGTQECQNRLGSPEDCQERQERQDHRRSATVGDEETCRRHETRTPGEAAVAWL